MRTYPIVIFWSEEDEAYIGDVPDLRHCSAHGETPDEALREVQIALAAWLDVAKARGLAIPTPSAPLAAAGAVTDYDSRRRAERAAK